MKTQEGFPAKHDQIRREAKIRDFGQQADLGTVTFLRALVASRVEINILELGSGLGLSACWFLDGMDPQSTLTSIEQDKELIEYASTTLGDDPRLTLIHQEGGEFISTLARKNPSSFDLIFADTWPGKYFHLDETLSLLKPRGVYLIDDMLPQPNWPDGHAEKAEALIQTLQNRQDLLVSPMDFSTGLFYCVKQG